MAIQYPVRCRIIDIGGQRIRWAPQFFAKRPEVSKPHVGKEGIAERLDEWTIRITLDDGTILMGYECWWEPIEPAISAGSF